MKRSCFQSYQLACLCCLAIVVRLLVVFLFSEQLENDVDAYLAHAENLVAGNGFSKPRTNIPTAFRAPLLSWFYAAVLWCGGTTVWIGVLQAVVGAVTVWFTGRIAEAIGSPRTGKVAALILAVAPLSLFATASLMSETLFSCLVVSLIYVVSTWKETTSSNYWRGLSVGLLFGLAAICRPVIWAWGVCFGLYWLVKNGRNGLSLEVFVRSMLVMVGLWVVVFPWVLRNQLVLGHPVVMTTHGGYTLLLGNNSVFYEDVVQKPWGTTWQKKSLESWQLATEEKLSAAFDSNHVPTEIERDRWMNREAIKWIAAHPVKFLEATWLRFVRFWGVTPQRVPERFAFLKWAVTAFYVLLFFCVLIGVIRTVRLKSKLSQTEILMLLLVLSFTLVHLVYWSNMRMRTPLEPCLALWAAAAFIEKERTCSFSGDNSL